MVYFELDISRSLTPASALLRFTYYLHSKKMKSNDWLVTVNERIMGEFLIPWFAHYVFTYRNFINFLIWHILLYIVTLSTPVSRVFSFDVINRSIMTSYKLRRSERFFARILVKRDNSNAKIVKIQKVQMKIISKRQKELFKNFGMFLKEDVTDLKMLFPDVCSAA